MGYDLAFWCDDNPSERDPQAVYEALLAGRQVEGLGAFRLDAALAALAQRFPGMHGDGAAAAQVGKYASWDRADGAAAVEFSWSPQHLLATARGAVSNDEMNAIIDICVGIGGARLYDPQTGERFDAR